MHYPLDEDEVAVMDDDTLRVFSYYDRNEDVRKQFTPYTEFAPGDEVILGHISPSTPFRYTGTVDHEGTVQFHFDNPTSDFAVTELVLSPNDFMVEMGDAICHF